MKPNTSSALDRVHAARGVLRALTAPGGAFELVDVQGPPTRRNFAKRDHSVRELLVRSARRGENEFLVQGDRRVTFGGFASLVWGTSEALVQRFGLRSGDRFAVLGPNSLEWLVGLFAATSAGAVGVALNAWWSVQELAFGLQDSGARFLLIHEDHFEAIEQLIANGAFPALDVVLVWGQSSDPLSSAVAFHDVMRDGVAVPDVHIDESDAFVILYTSGTTGEPKGCITTHEGTIAQLRSTILNGIVEREINVPARGLEQTDAVERLPPCLLATTPFFHVSGLHAAICLSLAVGSRVVLPRGRFDPIEALGLIENERITSWGAVPTMVHRLVNSPDAALFDLSSIQHVSIGGAPLAPEILDRARQLLGYRPKLANGYGLTETHGPVTINAGTELAAKPGSVGRPNPLLRIRIVDADGCVLPPNDWGEIQVSGVTVTPGYWNRPEATAETIVDGWLRTGDLGYLDTDGYLFIVDRIKDVIIRGGENVYSIEIENCIAEHADVDEVAVLGVPDAELGQRVVAVVRGGGRSQPTEAAIRTHLADRLARFKVPDRVYIVEEPLPRNAAGKVVKAALRTALDLKP